MKGLVVIAGGKYTTYRIMAKDAIDAAVHGMASDLDRITPPCCTEDVPLLGADGFEAVWNQRQMLAASSGLGIGRIEHLLHRYGSLISELLDLIAEQPDLGKPLTGADDYLRAEIVYAASHEGARHLDDAIARRTRISIETFDRGTEVAVEVAGLMGDVLGWTKAQRENEVDHYLKRVEAELESQTMPDDETADAARMGAGDVVPVSTTAYEGWPADARRDDRGLRRTVAGIAHAAHRHRDAGRGRPVRGRGPRRLDPDEGHQDVDQHHRAGRLRPDRRQRDHG